MKTAKTLEEQGMNYREFQCRICHVVCVKSISTIDLCETCKVNYGIDKLEQKLKIANSRVRELEKLTVKLIKNK